MQVQVKTAAIVNYDGHVLDVKPGVAYDGAFAQFLYDGGHDVTVTEGEPAKVIAKVEDAAEKVKAKTIGELRELAEALGLEHKGVKKADLQAAVDAKQAETQDETPAEPVTEGEPATPETAETEAEPSE